MLLLLLHPLLIMLVNFLITWLRTAMNVAQLGGPWIGGTLIQEGGFYLPFLVMGCLQVTIALISTCLMPHPDPVSERDHLIHSKKKKGKATVCKILSVPSVWLSFIAFIVATMCNGFLSVNLEPQVIRNFNLSASNVGIYIELNIYLLILALCINGMGVGGQQIAGVIDALHEAVGAGFHDDPSTQGLIAGMWSSLSGAGRFISRAGSGCLVDQFGFAIVSAMF